MTLVRTFNAISEPGESASLNACVSARDGTTRQSGENSRIDASSRGVPHPIDPAIQTLLQTDVAISVEKAPYAPQARQVTALSASLGAPSHGKGSATRQSRAEEAQEGKGEGDRRRSSDRKDRPATVEEEITLG
jgi:hypothetical protein